MTAASSNTGRADTRHTARPMRVILVGRSALDQRLRADPRVELVRARTPLDAVGELALSATGWAAEDRDARTVVLVTPDADPAITRAGGQTRTDGVRASEFLSALRHIDPDVRVLRVEAADGAAPARAGYDGVVEESADVDALRGAVARAAGVPLGPTPAPAPTTPTIPTTTRPAPAGRPADAPLAPAPPVGDVGDEALVRQLLSGRDVTEPATEAIRRRLDAKDVWFEPGDAAAAGPHECPVEWRGRVLGRLRAAGTPREALEPQARWLAGWLALREQHAQLREAAFVDALTGAYNRRFFEQFLRGAIDQSRATRRPLTVMVFDIDDFKQYNDRFGHAAGDEILRETVRLLRSVIRPSDKVCRIGGDEFAVIFHEPEGPRTPTSRPPSDIAGVAQRFQRAVAQQKFPKLGNDAPGTLGISGGLATYPWDGTTAEDLLCRADELAMQSKKAGKNALTFGPGARGDAPPASH